MHIQVHVLAMLNHSQAGTT